jgi:hypothetical protein
MSNPTVLAIASPAAQILTAYTTDAGMRLLRHRRGIRRPWLYFVSSLFTSFAFAWAFYPATTAQPTPPDGITFARPQQDLSARTQADRRMVA